MTQTVATIKEIAEALGLSLSQAKRRAAKCAWPFSEEVIPTGGKRRLYPLFDLPKDVRGAVLAFWAGRRTAVGAPYAPTPSASNARDLGDISEGGLRRMDAMLEILAELDRWRQAHPKVPKFGGFEAFSALYNARKIDLPDWVYEARPTVSKNTLHTHERLRGQGKLRAMGGQFGNRRGTGVFERCSPLRALVEGVINQRPRMGATAVRKIALTELGKTVEVIHPETGGVRPAPMPSVKSFERFIAAWKQENKALHAAITDPDKYNSAYRYAAGAMYGDIMRRNQLWEIDASPADAMCLDGRWSIYVMVDVFCRWPKVRVTRTPKTAAALLLVRDSIIDWGFPETLRTDNGSDFTSKHFRNTVRRMGIQQEVCPPFTPEAKACVERTIGTIQRSFMEMQPGYVGHSVMERKAIEARKSFAQRLGQDDTDAFCVELTGAELEKRLNAWIENVYVHEPHDGLGGKTPFEIRSAYRGRISRLDGNGEGALEHLLMAPPDKPTRVVGKEGVKVNGIDYYLREAFLMPGETVHVRLDPDDLGKIYVYRDDPWSFIGVAINPEREGVSRKEVAKRVQAEQAKAITEGKKRIRKAMRGVNLATVSLKMSQQGAEHAASLVAFPEKASEYSTADMEAAALAARAGRTPDPSPRTAADDEAQAALVADFAAAREQLRPETAEQKYDRWQALEARVQAGATLGESEARFHRLFRQSSAWAEVHEHRQMIEEFNRAMSSAG